MRRSPLLVALVALSAAPLLACPSKHVSITGELRYGKTAEENYQAGEDLLKRGDYPESTKFFEYVKTKYPFSKYAALADLRLADLKFKQDRYLEAAEAYASFVKLHPTHEDVEYAEYRVGLSRFKDAPSDFALFPPAYEKDQRQIVQAAKSLQEFLDRHPTSKWAPEARKTLAEAQGRLAAHEWYVADFYYKRKRWAGAAGRLETLVDKYPGSKHEPEALMRLAHAWLELNEKARAQRALQQLIVKHPQDARRPEAEKLLAKLR